MRRADVPDARLTTPTYDEVDYMAPRGLWDDFQQHWTPLQKALYLGQLRDHQGLTVSARAALGVGEDEVRRELEGLWGVLLWDRAQPDSVPVHRD
jgi:hypothetical protein